ncbi:MarR family winged helix-turn-helix transcriptional regulator [Floccifex sp.]|uniref:MarR family winged helix-turn-helix transcriptional regulator n=1 Tax=Floccifex sp. TaxID=2815810 RepID=UPI002A74D2AA|nr:MarR family transcriptional regulator [Floccifex sp.]MDD7282110.1 MarR family transcriptional regulator [Erysipelotrichaceae bacterium]MDY2957438.1 MarR family transcriptional regulator [Floccifex sp.]
MSDQYGLYINMISRNLKNKVDEKLKEIDLTKSQSDILHYLSLHEHEYVVQKDLEKAFQISNPTVTGLLNRLEQKGYIKRISNPNDKRAKQIILQDKARDVLSMVENQIEENENILLKGFTKQEADDFLKYINKALNNLTKEEIE